jgi:hypothetical protein
LSLSPPLLKKAATKLSGYSHSYFLTIAGFVKQKRRKKVSSFIM